MFEIFPRNVTELLRAEFAPASSIQTKPDLIHGLPDGLLSLAAPVIAYWIFSTFFHLVDLYELAEKYRIHPSEEVLSRNTVSQAEVIHDVIVQHIVQTTVGYVFFLLDPTPMTGFELREMWELQHRFPSVPAKVIYLVYTYGFSLIKIVCAFVVIDTWQFFLHRLMHLNKTLYRRFHSRHHKLYVPYAFGALFNDPVEGFLLDTLGAGLAGILMRLTPRETIILFTFSTMKTVDDHCGYALPYDPFQWLFPNNSMYHDIHHQHFGIKSNFSQPFFTFWDKFFKTDFKEIDKYRDEQRRITLEKYHEYLQDRKNRRVKASVKKEKAVYSGSEDEPEDAKTK
ncbi:unnamed protein product [Kuraishia capsulata CBS 1993]|uniref:Fatty acid hydroxylase domain-containing protein n=1 Tax=Kuraishia capsulata CBS 1993 TaxID=1382522 RepID=W6MX67_9ASCO|nr:uncharacterized protein KUCA_T00004342001 [Kuraishia capsulata CBS 1993]CDK28360.1 unnamed protein product [Kuraishia capsulata CBS 1993]